MNYVRACALMSITILLVSGIGWAINGQAGAILGATLATMGLMLVMWRAHRVIVELHGGREIDASDSSPIHRVFVADVDMLARRAGLEKPRTFIIDLSQPNAFVVGRDSHNASIVVTVGLLQSLTRVEAQAVIAHELAHLRRGDVLSMAIVSSFACIVAGVAGCIGIPFARRKKVSAWAARLVTRMSMSRAREYAADRLAADICGCPLQLARALEKIGRSTATITNPVAECHPAAAHLYVLDPLTVAMGSRHSTHPDTADRVARLRRKAALAAIALSTSGVEMA